MKNTQTDTKYQFSICNFTKPFSLFKQGMQVQMFSKKRQSKHMKALMGRIAKAEEDGTELDEEAARFKEKGIVDEMWRPVGTNIVYKKSMFERGGWSAPGRVNLEDEEDVGQEQDDLLATEGDAGATQNLSATVPEYRIRKRWFYQMNFELEFPYSDDTVYLAYSRPYPYSKILAEMFSVEEGILNMPALNQGSAPEVEKKDFKLKIVRKGIVYERRLLCRTICGLPVPHIQVTSPTNNMVDFKKRKTIFITARVHPGETSASTVYEGFMQGLFQGDQGENAVLLGHFIFRTIPCLNPDGVVCGNYRSSLAGVDLNR